MRKEIQKPLFPFDVEKLNEIIQRRKNEYDDETKYLINCLWYKASQINRLDIILLERNHAIITLCQDAISERIKSKKLTVQEIQEIKKSSENMVKEISWNCEQRNISNWLRFDILHRDNFTCTYCGRSAPEVILHIDHKLPFSKWGKTKKDNLITSCSDCNLGKKNKYDTSKKQ